MCGEPCTGPGGGPVLPLPPSPGGKGQHKALCALVERSWESSAAVPREVLAGEETPRRSGGMRRAGGKTSAQLTQPCPREALRAHRHPNPALSVPKMGQNPSTAGLLYHP